MEKQNPYIIWVEHLDENEMNRAGSKMARLGELRRISIKVPDGFCVSTDGFQYFMKSNDLEKRIIDEVNSINNVEDLESVEIISKKIRQLIIDSTIPKDLSQSIRKAYQKLSFKCSDINLPTAVRSSATGEDSAESSFAGQFDTYLGITGRDRLVKSVQKCWASLFTGRALSYRLKNNLSHRDSPMAVGVLELVNARVSGVAFSIHPVSGSKDRMVIEGNWGWGEAVVQGIVTPDHIEVGKSDLRILDHQISNKEIVSAFNYKKGKIIERKMPKLFRNEPILNDEEIIVICKTVKDIESNYGYPVDVEWVIDKNRRIGDPITIVQTRPETVHSNKGNEHSVANKWDPVAYAKKYAFKNNN